MTNTPTNARSQKEFELKRQFKRNLKMLKSKDRSLYDAVRKPCSSLYQLIVDERGEVNISSNGQSIYPPAIIPAIGAQIAQFEQAPARLRIPPLPIESRRSGPHFDTLKKVWEQSPVVQAGEPRSGNWCFDRKNIGFLMVFGIGLGYHIKGLIDRYDIRQLVLVDLDPGPLRISMHVMDWTPIIAYFKRKQRRLRVVVGGQADTCAEKILHIIRSGNMPLVLNGFIYKHFDNPIFEQARRQMAKDVFLLISGWGFFDDERASLIQALETTRIRVPAWVHKPRLPIGSRAFLLAAGPSLDKGLEVVAEHQGEAVIISCGTAIGSLYKHGIQPDFHVEIERNYENVLALQVQADAEYLSGVRLVAPNRVHRLIFKMFEHCFTYAKELDTGGALLDSPHRRSFFSNPTVANGGMALAADMGFSEVLVFGMDLGFVEAGRHHADGSLHYEQEDFKKVAELYYSPTREIEAVGGGTIPTTGVFAWSKRNIEFLLQRHPQINVVNFSGGASIKGTQECVWDEYAAPAEIPDKSAVIAAVEACYSNQEIDPEYAQRQLAKLRADLQQTTTELAGVVAPDVADAGELMDRLGELDHYMKRVLLPRNEVLHLLIAGSFMHLPALIYTHQGACTDREKAVDFINFGFRAMGEFMQEALASLPESIDELDTFLAEFDHAIHF